MTLIVLPDVRAVEAVLSDMFPTGSAAIQAATPIMMFDALWPEERDYISRASAARQAEFSTARVCARLALQRLGFPPCALVPGSERAPTWPPGTVGSISHTARICAVVAARSTRFVSVGLDVEMDSPLESALEPLVCTPAERDWLDTQAGPKRGRWLKLLFSAKESFYKCQHAMTGRRLDFLDVALSVDIPSSTFAARPAGSRAPRDAFGGRGRWRFAGHHVITAFSLPR
jgi:4'-phosphopantetheinyl transferase EntD